MMYINHASKRSHDLTTHQLFQPTIYFRICGNANPMVHGYSTVWHSAEQAVSISPRCHSIVKVQWGLVYNGSYATGSSDSGLCKAACCQCVRLI